MSSSPRKLRKVPPRPKITLPVPSQFPGHYSQTPIGYVTTSYGQAPVPLTPVSGQPTIIYPNKASDFVFGHFKGFKDWTKSGLSAGEKSAFWLYEKVSSWSKRWFTHIFLFFVLFLYSVLGAFLFLYIEGKYESAIQDDINKERDEMIQEIRNLWNDKRLVADSEKWKVHAKNHLMLYEEKLYQFLKKLNFQSRPDNVNWAFWNAIIYCSTIYTTIVKGEETNSMDEDDERRARMERMVEDTERLERIMSSEDDRSRTKMWQYQHEESMSAAKVRATSPVINRVDKFEGTSREDERKIGEPTIVKNVELPTRSQEQQRVIVKHPSMKMSRRSREPNDEMEFRRRMSSPETAKIRSTRHPSSSPPTTMSPRDNQQDRRGSKKCASNRRHYQNDSDEDEPSFAVEQRRPRRSPSKPINKQIIPLSDSSLDEDLDDYDYEDYEGEEEYEEYIPRRKKESTLRKRKTSLIYTDQEKERIGKSINQSTSWFSWIPFFGRNKQKVDDITKDNNGNQQKKDEKGSKEVFSSQKKSEETSLETTDESSDKVTFCDFLRSIRDITAEFNEYCRQCPREVQILYELRNLCIVETIATIIICGLGGIVFRFTEGAFESFYKCGVKRVKRDFLDSLWNYSHNMKEDDWKSMARRKLMEFEEQLHTAHEAGVHTYSGQRSWSFLNAMVYCLTIVSTIGYGHISPSTTTGRALTIIYAIFGIPMFLIVLADFGKLFTRGIKFLWAFVRRLYYTGSCRKVRRTVPMQEMMKGVQLVYDLAHFRRPSQMSPEDLAEIQRQQQNVLSVDGNTPQQADSPSTPAMSTFEIDDEFNLPISVAIAILILYIFIGAIIFNVFEDWTFFESFYFVFISMSTIGFGDFVPQDPLYMMLSIVYLIFGLALTSMCINVVQVMLADQFKHASQKIGASIGFQVSEEDGSLKPAAPDPVEVAEVHSTTGTTAIDSKDKVAPKAKEEDDEL